MVTIDLTVLVLPEGSERSSSPGLTVPVAIWPEKPRKSRLGRLTHCTGMRKGLAWLAVLLTSMVSRWSISTGPSYQLVLSERVVMLSPARPDIGMAVKVSIPMLLAKAA